MLSRNILANVGCDCHALKHFLTRAIKFTLEYLRSQLGFRPVKFSAVWSKTKNGAIKTAFERREIRNGRVQVNRFKVAAQIALRLKRALAITNYVVRLRKC